MYAQNKFGNFQCPCCDYFTLSEGRSNSYEVCPICFWEDDGIQLNDLDYAGGANELSLNRSRKNYLLVGASEESFLDVVRSPQSVEMPDK